MKIYKRHTAYAADRTGSDSPLGYVTLGEVESVVIEAIASGVPRSAQLQLEISRPGYREESGVTRIGLYWDEVIEVDVVEGATESPLGARQ